MKKLVALALTMACMGFVNAQQPTANTPITILRCWTWNEYEHIVFQIDGHQYLEVRYRGMRDSASVSVIHYESCPCKAHH